MSEEKSRPVGDDVARLAGKYMTFKLDREAYALPILKVRELVGLLEVTRIPGAPSWLKGVVNLRGKVVPVVDLRARFGLGEQGRAARPVIIVVQVEGAHGPITLGVLVDEVLDVRMVAAESIETTPELGDRAAEMEFILGLAKTDKSVFFLLDIDRVLTAAEVARMAEARPPEAGPPEAGAPASANPPAETNP